MKSFILAAFCQLVVLTQASVVYVQSDINDDTVCDVFEVVSFNGNFKNFNLEECTLLMVAPPARNQMSEGDLRNLAHALRKAPYVEGLGLVDVASFSDNIAKEFADWLKVTPVLRRLRLSNVPITPAGAEMIFDALDSNTKLGNNNDLDLTLELPGCNLRDESTVALSDLMHELKAISAVAIPNNQIGPEGAEGLANAINSGSNILQLLLPKNNIGDEGAVAFANALMKDSEVDALDLGFNSITATGGAALAAALEKNEFLATLALSGNNLGDETAKLLSASIIAREGDFDSLLLSDTKITNNGFSELLHAAEESSIGELDVSHNALGDVGMKLIANSLLTGKSSLSDIRYGNNQLSDVGLKYLVDVLKLRKDDVQVIDLSGNYITDEGANLLLTVTHSRRDLVVFVERNEGLSADTLEELRDAFGGDEGFDEVNHDEF